MRKACLIVLILFVSLCFLCCEFEDEPEIEGNCTLLPSDTWWNEQPKSGVTIQKTEIKNISFVKSKPQSSPVKKWNVDIDRLGCIKVYVCGTSGNYSLYFVGKEIKGNEDSQNLFESFEKLKNISFGHFDTSEVTEMTGMFSKCSSLKALNLKTFDTSKISSMAFMFYGCESLTSLDLSNFDTSNVLEADGMFAECSRLLTLNLSSFNPSNIESCDWMFFSCEKLGAKITINPQYSDFFNNTELGETDYWTYLSGVYTCVATHKCTVSCYDGTSLLFEKIVNNGETIYPSIPVKPGYIFLGWYYDKDFTDYYDGSKPVTTDIKLYSRWATGSESAKAEANVILTELSIETGDTITAVFNAGGYAVTRTADIPHINVKSVTIDSYTVPTTGTLDVKVFSSKGTLKGSATETVTFKNENTYDITVLEAGKEYHSITFETNGGSAVSTQKIQDGKQVLIPSPNPTKKGYTFAGWYNGIDLETPYSFSTAVTSDITLYAKWTEVSKTEKWCVMTYMDFSNLTEYALENLDEICQSIPNDNVKAYFLTGGAKSIPDIGKYPNLSKAIEPLNPSDPFGASGKPDAYQLWEYTSNGKFKELSFPSLKGMNDSNILAQFMELCFDKANDADPNADYKYILELWDHGGGSYVGLIKDDAVLSYTFEGIIMSLSDCGSAIKSVTEKKAFRFEVVIFDMCLMQSIETAHTVSYACTNYIIGSQTSSSAIGSAYTDWFNFLYKHPESNGYDFGKVFCDASFTKLKNDGSQLFINNITWSVLDMSQFAAVESAYENYTQSVLSSVSALDVEQCLKKIDSMPAFSTLWELYMYDINVFTETLGTASAGANLIKAINTAVVYKKYGTEQLNAGCCGLSMCLLTNTNGWEQYGFSQEWNSTYLNNCLTPNFRSFQEKISNTL